MDRKQQKPAFAIRSKVWIEGADGKVAFGLGRYRILEAIRRTGSLHAASKELKMSYRAIWMRIRTSEESIGRSLVVRDGNGSRLTGFAEELMTQFESMQAGIEQNADAYFKAFLFNHLKSGD
ncbi:MAG: winged helix-turn-helix domain-containing protein [Desulfobacterales bacterium]